ncbi:MAG TPA: LPS export ABC transporter periplasmic protein LptC [Phenylobacterium sp.]|jgi:lipopolysaccharide export system protein LptC|nr:LPS export ABC transporter periplasmic protein LptC [Phenylobacterium sp.]
MTAAADMSLPTGRSPRQPHGRTSIQLWRKRSRVIAGLRILLPSLIGLILVGLAGTVAYSTLAVQKVNAGNASDPIRLVNPHFVGRDSHGRPFVLTSVTATRDPTNYQRVFLDKPVLVVDVDGPDPTHITGGAGVFHEDTGKLEMSKGVRLSDARGAFDTAQSVFDTKTEDLVGSGPIQGLGSLGEIHAKSYGVYDKGARMVFTGNVHSRLQPK